MVLPHLGRDPDDRGVRGLQRGDVGHRHRSRDRLRQRDLAIVQFARQHGVVAHDRRAGRADHVRTDRASPPVAVTG